MPILNSQTTDSPLSSAELFCNMSGGTAFRIVEMYKSIRTSLMFTLSASKDNVILVTSAEPNSGKSVTSANLGLSFSQTGSKVLVIDCDMRNPSQQKIYAQENTKGLSNVLSNMCTFEDTVKRNVKENLDLLTAGQTPPNPSELLGSDNMRALLEQVRGQYDFIFLDCPPVELVSDASSLLLLVPQAIVIARQNHAIYDEVIHTVETIKSVGGKILGAILTDVREEEKSYMYAAGSYSHYGRYGYGHRYGYGSYGRYGKRYGRYGYGRYGSRYGRYGKGYGKYGYGYGYGAKTEETPEAATEAKTESAKKTEQGKKK